MNSRNAVLYLYSWGNKRNGWLISIGVWNIALYFIVYSQSYIYTLLSCKWCVEKLRLLIVNLTQNIIKFYFFTWSSKRQLFTSRNNDKPIKKIILFFGLRTLFTFLISAIYYRLLINGTHKCNHECIIECESYGSNQICKWTSSSLYIVYPR